MADFNNEEANGLYVKIARLEEKLTASADALKLAREAMEIWKTESNNVRRQILEERGLYPTVPQVDLMISRAIESTKSFSKGETQAWAIALTVMVTIVGVITLIIHFVK